MKIYNSDGIELYDLMLEDRSVRYRAVMEVSSFTLQFSCTESIDIPLHSYVIHEGERYMLWRPSEFKKHGTRNHQYTLTLHGWGEFLKMVKYKDMSSKPYRLKFSIVATPLLLLQNLVNCLNNEDPGWTVGDCIDAPEKLFAFNHEYCVDVLGRFCQEWNTEFEYEGKTVHLRRVEKYKDEPLPLSYGKGKGFLPGVGRYNEGDKSPVGKLFVEGGDRNIDYSKYGSKTLLLPKSQTITYNGKIYQTDEDGMYITRLGNNNLAEDSFDASNIYPKRVGTITSVEVIDEEEHFYDIIDTSIPETLDYAQCRIAGEKVTIKFESGMLAGYGEFDIEQTDDELTGYVHAERRFKIIPAEHNGYVMPGGVFVPALGDKYSIFHISLPDAYIRDDATSSGASWDMFRETVRYFSENEENRFRFTGELDGIYSKSKWLEIGGKIVPGSHILFSDEQFLPLGAVIRIIAIKDYVHQPHKPEITLSNAPISSSFSSDLGKIEADEVVIEDAKKEAIRFTKRQWRDVRETMSLLQKSLLNFTGGINPITVQTMQLLVGDQSLQFRFVYSETTPSPVAHIVSYNGETKEFTANGGIIQHMTLGITDIKNNRPASEYMFWDVAEYVSPPLVDEKAYYLYAKCSKTDGSGIFLLSEAAISMESEAGFYHFLVGILNSVNDKQRSYAPLYGFTEILPGQITTDVIRSTDGITYFDLVNGVIGGRLKFLSNGTETDLALWADDILDELYETEQAMLDLGDYIDDAFHDGLIEEAEAKAIATYINQVNKEKSDLEATYNKLYLNPLLTGTPKTNLLNSKITLFGDINNLISVINTAIADGRTIAAEKTQVDNAFSSYRDSLAVFRTRIEEANQAIQQYLKGESDGARAAAAAAEAAANAASQDVGDLTEAVEDLDVYVDGAFHDGLIEEAEAKAIETYINQILSEKGSLEATYNKLYINSYLTGAAKTNLLNAKVNYFGTVDNLVASINSIISDGKVTPAEKQSINAIFSTYRADKASFSTRIEEANQAIQNYLKSNSDAIDAKVNIAKAITDKFGTTIDGGLINTMMMLLREIGSVQETAGMSGIRGILKDNPAYWAGGTYEQAFALINFLSKMSTGTTPSTGEYAGLAKITLLHNGAAKLGDFIIESSGRIVMVDPLTGKPRLIFGIQNIPAVADLISGTIFSGSTNIGSGSTTSVLALSGSTNVTKYGAMATFGGTTISINASGKAQAGGISSFAVAELYAYRNGVKAFTLATAIVHFTNTVNYQNDLDMVVVPVRNIYLADDGSYTFKLEVITEGDINYASADCSSSSFAWLYTLQNVRYQQYGLDGMMFYYSNNHFHFTEGGGLDIRGATNIPGVLGKGRILSSGSRVANNSWGAKNVTTSVTKQGTGGYRVPVSCPDGDYDVNINPRTANRTFMVGVTAATYFEVYFRDQNGSLADSEFSYTLVGNNYS